MKKMIPLLVAAIAVASSSLAQAQQTGPFPGFYAGLSIGQSKGTNVSEGEVNDFLRQQGYTNVFTSADKKDTTYRVTGGYQFNPNVAVELLYTDIGTFGTRSTVTGGTVNADYKAKGFGVDLVLSAPMTEQFSVFGRVGAIQAKTEASFSSSGTVGLGFAQGSKNKTGQHYGLGLQYALSREIAVRAEVERFRKLGDDSTGGELQADAYTVGVIFRF